MRLFAGLAQGDGGFDIGRGKLNGVDQPSEGRFIELGSFVVLKIGGYATYVYLGVGRRDLRRQAASGI